MQTSSNLTTWSDAGVVKVHNGAFESQFSNGLSMPNIYFRAFYDPSLQDLVSTVQNALMLPSAAFNYATPVLPPNFLVQPILGQDNTPTTNITTDAGATLGRVLFYDKRLSTNQTVACASCHKQANGFSDPQRFSTGFAGGLTSRNSMGLSNARWYQRRHFFWDERANTLEDQVLVPIQNPVEMGMTLPALTTRLAAEHFYTNLFTRTCGIPDGNVRPNIARTGSHVNASIVSIRNKYDTGESNRFANFTAQETLGRQIFLGQVGNATCAACHGTDNFATGAAINNNGLEFPYSGPRLGGNYWPIPGQWTFQGAIAAEH